MIWQLVLIAACCAVMAEAQEDGVYRLEPGITPAKILHKAGPVQSDTSRALKIEGSVLFEFVVDLSGKPVEIALLRPMGFGLDEKARKSLETWRFEPATKDGKPVRLLSTAEVSCRLGEPGARRSYRDLVSAVTVLDDETKDKIDKSDAVFNLRRLSAGGYAPAMYVLSILYKNGQYIDKDSKASLKWLREAEKQRYGPALYDQFLGLRKAGSEDLDLLRESAENGSPAAQLEMGILEKDPAQAARFLLMCSVAGDVKCQSRLGEIQLNQSGRTYLRALAWLQRAAVNGDETAKTRMAKELEKLDPEQRKEFENTRSSLNQILKGVR